MSRSDSRYDSIVLQLKTNQLMMLIDFEYGDVHENQQSPTQAVACTVGTRRLTASSGSFIRVFRLKLKCHLFKYFYSDPSDHSPSPS